MFLNIFFISVQNFRRIDPTILLRFIIFSDSTENLFARELNLKFHTIKPCFDDKILNNLFTEQCYDRFPCFQ